MYFLVARLIHVCKHFGLPNLFADSLNSHPFGNPLGSFLYVLFGLHLHRFLPRTTFTYIPHFLNAFLPENPFERAVSYEACFFQVSAHAAYSSIQIHEFPSSDPFNFVDVCPMGKRKEWFRVFFRIVLAPSFNDINNFFSALPKIPKY